MQDNDSFEVVEDATGIDSTEHPIMIPKEELIRLLIDNFEPNHDNLATQVNCLFYSQYEQEELEEIIRVWYNSKGPHHQAETPNLYMGQYYEYTESNKWFFTLANHLPDEIKAALLWKYSISKLNTNAKIDMAEKLGLRELRNTNYRFSDGTVIVETNHLIMVLLLDT